MRIECFVFYVSPNIRMFAKCKWAFMKPKASSLFSSSTSSFQPVAVSLRHDLINHKNQQKKQAERKENYKNHSKIAER